MTRSICLIMIAFFSIPCSARSDEDKVRTVVRSLDKFDTAYIEPQHYNWTVMIEGTQNLDMFMLAGGRQERHHVTLSTDMSPRVGPYFGWRWLFLGYTFELKHLGLGETGKRKRELELSLYTSRVGADLFYRRTGNDYRIRNIYLGDDVDVSGLEDISFDGISVSVTGISVYYIFNNRHYSYPAAFSQSTCQKKSCGSFIAGLGYTQNSLSMDVDKFLRLVKSVAPEVKVDSDMLFRQVMYTNYNISAGYGYNYVFRPKWLFCASGQLALAYKHSSGDTGGDESGGFRLDNVNIDGVGRFSVVYNNTRWYAGASAIINTNNYHKARFTTSNLFGSLNIYMGINFGLKKRYKKK